MCGDKAAPAPPVGSKLEQIKSYDSSLGMRTVLCIIVVRLGLVFIRLSLLVLLHFSLLVIMYLLNEFAFSIHSSFLCILAKFT